MSLEQALAKAGTMADWLVEETIRVCSIPAPGFEEKERAEYVAARMREYGLEDVHVDKVFNAIGVMKGKGKGKKILFAAHIDTVFPRSQKIEIKREPGKVWAPGIRDNSAGTVGMLGMIKVLKETGFQPEGDYIFAATSGEEGLGDLKGMKQAMKEYNDVTYAVGIDGELGNITHQGVGSRRLNVKVHAAGGHSFGAFGASSAIHSMAKMIAGIAQIKVPAEPKTTYNVGVISGGHSVNSIATDASMLIDMRSVGTPELAKVEAEVRDIMAAVCKADDVTTDIEVVGDRPAGGIPSNNILVQAVQAVHKEMGIESELSAGSTDANVPLSMGIPAICIGFTTGGNAHRPDEWLDTAPVATGLKQLLMVAYKLQTI
jgi:tripeptide aminopeptidase